MASTRRAAAITRQPRCSKRWAVAAPMPLEAPVIRTVRLVMRGCGASRLLKTAHNHTHQHQRPSQGNQQRNRHGGSRSQR